MTNQTQVYEKNNGKSTVNPTLYFSQKQMETVTQPTRRWDVVTGKWVKVSTQ